MILPSLTAAEERALRPGPSGVDGDDSERCRAALDSLARLVAEREQLCPPRAEEQAADPLLGGPDNLLAPAPPGEAATCRLNARASPPRHARSRQSGRACTCAPRPKDLPARSTATSATAVRRRRAEHHPHVHVGRVHGVRSPREARLTADARPRRAAGVVAPSACQWRVQGTPSCGPSAPQTDAVVVLRAAASSA